MPNHDIVDFSNTFLHSMKGNVVWQQAPEANLTGSSVMDDFLIKKLF